MKAYIKYIFIVLSLAWLMVSCNDDDSPAYDFKQAPVISPLAFPSLVLNENAANFIAETFSWTLGDYGFPAAPTFILQVDDSKEFADPIILGESTKDYVSIQVSKLNMATIILGGEAGKPRTLYIRLQANLTPSVFVYSEPVDLQITPYAMVIDYPKLYVPGNYQGWNIEQAPTLISYRMNNKYEGDLNLVVADDPSGAVKFKLTTMPDWTQGNSYGAGSGPGTLSLGGGDITFSPQGRYHMKVDLNTLTYTMTPISVD